MRKFFKLITYLIIILILLAVVAGVLVATLVDPNKFKEKISQRVVQETGRTLAINGNIEHSFFPWLGLKVHDVTLGNAPGFSPKEPFLNVGEMDVEVKLLPLLGGAVEIGKIVLKDASLNLAKNAAGQTNWDDLLSKKKKEVVKSEPTEESSPRAKFFKTLSVAGIEVVDANVSWVDQKNNQTIKLTKVSVVSEDIVSGKKFPLTIKFNIAGLPDHLSGEYELNADITLDTQNNLYTLDDFKFNVTMPAENSYEIKGSANKITLDLPDQTLDVVDFKASGNALEMEADLHVEQLVEAPVYTGNLNVKSSNLRNFLKAIKKEVQTKDTNVLGNFSFSANFRGTDNSLRLDAVNLHLDDSISKGNANITSFKPLAVDFNQTIDQLNVDRYRKPDASPSPAMSTEQASALPSQPTVSADTSNKTDFASLRKLTIGGGLNIGLLTVGETEFSQVHVQLLLQNGVLNVSPFTAQVH
ncbi:MAG: asmA, partial [Gammaproteobacteria bacterium]|nr:asmA [Gammaproteobacteria bacterium]